MQNQIRTRKKTSKYVPRSRRKPAAPRRKIAPKKSLFRRILRLIFNPLTAAVSGLILLAVFLVGTYFWFEFSQKIDLLLSGEVFTRTAGIYSGPKTLRKGEKLSPDELVTYLKAAGYVEKNRKADETRSRFVINGNTVEIEPGNTALVDGKRNYRNLTVKFSKKGDSVSEIIDTESEEDLKKTALEPELLNSIASEGDGRRKAVTFKDIPPHLVKAITVTEDRAFFEHYGVNFRGIARALWRRYENEEGDSPLDNQGGSSITQQLVKNLLLSPERSYERKAKEAYMSIILEQRLSKQEIFTLYANQIYLGQNSGVSIYGVGEAANIYFGKDVSALTLSESAFIAGIIRSPNRYNPYKNLKRVESRRNQVLASMVEAKAISPKEAKTAAETKLVLNTKVDRKDLQGMQYFAAYAVEQIPKVVTNPDELQHLRVYTTIDPDLQKIANRVVIERLAKLEKYYKEDRRGNLNASLVAIKPKTGEIVAMIGGKNYQENQFNRAADALRQPGSAFKPFVYATALDTAYGVNSRTITPATIFKDEKKTFNFNQDTYSPNNYGDYFSNEDITLRDALVKSKNTITVELGMELNIGRVMNLAHKAGLPKVDRAYPSMALGTSEATPLQMAGAYTTFANMGDAVSPLAINRVTTGEGETIVEPKPEKKNVMRPDVAYIMNDMMKEVIDRGTAAEAKAWGFTNVEGKRAYAGKTGTSRDGWFAGFTPEIVCVVYVGFDDGSNLNLKGSDSAMPIWAEFMREALRLHPEWNGDWQMPASIRQAEIDIRNGNVIRELTDAEAKSVEAQNKILKANSKKETDADDETETDSARKAYLAGIPPEFRRIELFISGTVPTRLILPVEDDTLDDMPSPSPTPFTTWQDAQTDQNKEESDPEPRPKVPPVKSVSVMICPVLGMRATSNCPDPESKTFRKGAEPKEFCTYHARPRN
ncbi:MAG: PBP1A family penicillin-binding protein [Pyrinomonadaceae bacterium]